MPRPLRVVAHWHLTSVSFPCCFSCTPSSSPTPRRRQGTWHLSRGPSSSCACYCDPRAPPSSSPELTRYTPSTRHLCPRTRSPQLTRSACRGSRVAAKTECGLALHHVPAAVEARRTAAGERRAARPLPRVARAEWHRPAVGPRGTPGGAPTRPSCPLCDRPIPMRYARPSAGRTSFNRP